jgi:hypothetical protein
MVPESAEVLRKALSCVIPGHMERGSWHMQKSKDGRMREIKGRLTHFITT